MSLNAIRNFCIIAHIDHGKSTLADRFLEVTETVARRDMKEQLLDTMELEQERGITIKLQPVQMQYKEYTLNLIDTPGHVDFTYEVSRSLAAVEGAVLLVDATQGIQAQTIANLYLAIEQNLEIIPVINKIDLPNAEVEKTTVEIVNLLGCKEEDIILASGKTGVGVTDILDAVIKRVPAPVGDENAPLRALIFDSFYDDYRGVIAYVRVIDGQVSKTAPIEFIATKAHAECMETGILKPALKPQDALTTGHIGYIATGIKEINACRVGDTIRARHSTAPALPGYKAVKPMVFAGIFTKEGDRFNELREALEKLKLNDAALSVEPEHSHALGFGYRCGFLGLLHLDIIQERVRREFGLDLIITKPSVAYKVTLKSSGLKKSLEAQLHARSEEAVDLTENQLLIKSPSDLPEANFVETVEEPMVTVDIVTPKTYMGGIMQLAIEKRGSYTNTEYLAAKDEADKRAVLHFTMPLSMILTDFYDKIKSVSSGYASLNYEFAGYQTTDVVKLDILVADDHVEALTSIVYRNQAERVGRDIVETLKESLPRQQFVVKIQAAVGGTIVAAERLSALRKDVTAKLYGGDVTRKRKLLEKQKKGKKKMMALGTGRVDIPTDTFMKVLKK